MLIGHEQLAYWYLRLNGFLTIPNFVVHPDSGNRQETEVDILGVRFPYRAENLLRPMKDDAYFMRHRDKSFIVVAEVKTGICDLNGPWTNPERQNMLRVVRAVGAFPSSESDLVAQALYEKGRYVCQLYLVSLLCIGATNNQAIADRYPNVPQMLWPDILSFIYNRFKAYRNQKVSHPQWDQAGHDLWAAFQKSRDEEQFKTEVL